MENELFPARQEGRLDKFKAYYSEEGRELTPEAEETRIKLVKANTLLCKGWSPNRVKNALIKEYEIGERQAYNLIKDSISVFGNGFETNTKGEKYIMYESFMEAAFIAKKAGDYKTMVRALEKAGQIKGVFSETGSNVKDLAKLFTLSINYSTDPAALNKPKTIDIEGEEVE